MAFVRFLLRHPRFFDHGVLIMSSFKKTAFASLFGLAAFALPASAANILQGAAVSGSGGLNGTLSTITNGVFLAENTHWQNGTVWWFGTAETLTMALGGRFSISGFIVQADNNDTYALDYWTGSTWALAWAVPTRTNGGGMSTRPGGANHSLFYTLPSSIVTDQLRFRATGGDNSYSVSEIQADGVRLPEPGGLLLGATALLGALALRRR